MKPISRALCLLSLYLVPLYATTSAQSRDPFSYQNLSGQYYGRQKDSLKKAWACASVFENKATQKKYKEIWDGRTDFLTASLGSDEYVYSNAIQQYVEKILQEILDGNKTLLPEKPMVLIDRTPQVNAYAVGGNVMAVNLGMISFARTREELALILAHELAHNLLQHPETSMKNRAEFLTSDEYKASLKAVLETKYERYSRLKKVVEEYSFTRNRHQRYKEGDADSLAIVLLKNSGMAIDPIAFLRLDSADMQYKQALKKPLKDYFSIYGLTIEEAWTKKRSKGLSTRNYNFKDTATLKDSLKTHPDCEDRYARTMAHATPNARLTPVSADIKETANKMIVWQLYRDKRLTPCLFRIMLEKDKGNTDPWYDFMFYNVITGLTYADKTLSRFNAIGVVPKEYISESYYGLQTLLEQIPREQLATFCGTMRKASFQTQLDANEKAFGEFMFALATDPDNDDKKITRSAKEFSSAHAASPYREFTSLFEK